MEATKERVAQTAWRYGTVDSSAFDDHYEDWIPVLGADGKEICRVGATSWRHHSENNNADVENRDSHARLIAAAPDLLEALIEAREQLAKEIGLPVGECVGAHFVKINAAIAKATQP